MRKGFSSSVFNAAPDEVSIGDTAREQLGVEAGLLLGAALAHMTILVLTAERLPGHHTSRTATLSAARYLK